MDIFNSVFSTERKYAQSRNRTQIFSNKANFLSIKLTRPTTTDIHPKFIQLKKSQLINKNKYKISGYVHL